MTDHAPYSTSCRATEPAPEGTARRHRPGHPNQLVADTEPAPEWHRCACGHQWPARSRITTVALVGASCTGKTTLWESVGEWWPSAVRVPEAARTWFSLHPEVTDRFGLDAQREVQALAVRRELDAREHAWCTGARLVVCDRSVFDAPGYLHALGDHEGSARLHARVEGWSYDHIVVPDPADVPYRPDSVRSETATTRQRLHDGFLDYLTGHRLEFTVLSGSTDTRLDTLARLITPEGKNQ